MTIVTYGTLINEALAAVDLLALRGIHADLIKLNRVMPNSFVRCLRSLAKTGYLLTVEEVCEAGCVGKRLLAAASDRGVSVRAVRHLHLGEGVVTHGTVPELYHAYSLDAEGIAREATNLLQAEN